MIRYARTYMRPDRFNTIQYGPWKGLSVRYWTRTASGFIQKPILGKPNAYVSILTQVPNPPISTVGADMSYAASVIGPSGPCYFAAGLAYERAYGRLRKEAMGTGANVALTLIDSKKSHAMISSRLLTLISAVKSLKKGHIGDMAHTLGVGLLPKHTKTRRYKPRRGQKRTRRLSAPQDVANTWLEYSFGWSPLLADIHDAVKVLGGKPPSTQVKTSGKSSFSLEDRLVDADWTKQSVYGTVVCKLQANVRVTSPNLLLLNELGLINPAFVLWDAVPFSFVVDWILPVGKFLRSWTDFVGVELTDKFQTYYWVAWDWGNSKSRPGVYFRKSSVRKTQRILEFGGVPIPSFQGNPDAWKASISLALLTQKFHSELASLLSADKRSYFGNKL